MRLHGQFFQQLHSYLTAYASEGLTQHERTSILIFSDTPQLFVGSGQSTHNLTRKLTIQPKFSNLGKSDNAYRGTQLYKSNCF
jgi:hypothetical protein